MTPYQLLLADDHQVIINGLTEMLAKEERVEICAAVLRWEDLIPTLSFKKPQLLILDVNMQENNMLKKIPELLALFPTLKIVVFTSYDTPTFRREAAKLGVAFLTKNSSKQKILDTIFQVLGGSTITASQNSRRNRLENELVVKDK